MGFDELAPPGGRVRVQPAGSFQVLEVSFTTPLHVGELQTRAEAAHEAFLAGLMPGPVHTVFFDRHASVQIYLTPPGAYRLLDIPGRETAGHVLPLVDLIPRRGRDLPDRLAEAPGWSQRFTMVIDELALLAGAQAPADALTEWMWSQLQHTGGQARIADLAQHSGWGVRQVRAIRRRSRPPTQGRRADHQVRTSARGTGALEPGGTCHPPRILGPVPPHPGGAALRWRITPGPHTSTTPHRVHRA